MTGNGNDKNVTWKWLVGVLLAVVFSATGLIIADTRTSVEKARTSIEQVQEKKVDKEQYYRDIGEIKENLHLIVEKIEKIRR